MKYILGALLLVLSSSSIGMDADSIQDMVVCKGGYKFLYVWSLRSDNPPTVLQIMEVAGKNSLRPMKCTGSEKVNR